jgi:uncharacterized delta-60 repeat protein
MVMTPNRQAQKLQLSILVFVAMLQIVSAEPALLLDKTFHLSPDLKGNVSSMIQDPHGNIVALGQFHYPAPKGPSLVALFKADGTLIPEFDPSGIVGQDSRGALATSDDAIYIMAVFDTAEQSMSWQVRKLNYRGAQDTQFRATFPQINSTPRGILISERRVIVFGQFSGINGVLATNIARLQRDGSVDPSFSPKLDGIPTAGIIQPDGKIILAGNFAAYPGNSRLLRLNSDGTPDLSFTPSPALFNNDVGCIFLQQDGKIVVGGLFGLYGSLPRAKIARFLPNGTLDEQFDPGAGPDEPVTAIMQQQNGDLIICGSFNKYGTNVIHRLARLHPDGSLDPQFNSAKGPNSSVLSILPLPGDKQALISGYFGSIDNLDCSSPARINLVPPELPFVALTQSTFSVNEQDGEATVILKRYGDQLSSSSVQLETAPGTALADTDYRPVSTTVLFNAGESEKHVRIPILQDGFVELPELFEVNITARENCFGSDRALVQITDDEIPVLLDDSFQVTVAQDPHITPVLQSTGKIIVAAFDNPDSQQTHNLLRLEKNGNLDPSFKSEFPRNLSPYILICQPDDKLLVAGTTEGFDSVSHLIRLLPDGRLDPEFASPSGFINSLHLMPDGRMYLSSPLRRLNADGSVDSTFHSAEVDPNNTPVAVFPDGKALFVSRGFPSSPPLSIYRLNLDGSRDTNFHPNPTQPALNVVLQSDGKMLVMEGQYGTARQLERLNPDGSLDLTFSAAIPDYSFFSFFQVSPGEAGTIWLLGNYGLMKMNSNGTLDTSFIFSRSGLYSLWSIVPEADGNLLLPQDYVGGLKRIYGSNSNLTRIVITPEKPSVLETNRLVAFHVTRTGYTHDALDLNLQLDSKLGAPPIKLYQDRLQLAPLATNSTITLQVNDDDLVNWNEQVRLGADLSAVNHPIFQNAGALTIVDNDERPWNIYSGFTGPDSFPLGVDGAVQLPNGDFAIWSHSALSGPPMKFMDLNGRELTKDFFQNRPQPDEVLDLEVLPSGRILLAQQKSGDQSSPVLAFHPDGSPDTNFTFPFPWSYSRTVREQSDGRLIIGGFVPLPGFNYSLGVIRLETNGTLDPSFKALNVDFGISSIGVQQDDKILVAGPFGLKRLLKDGGSDPTFKSPPTGPVAGIFKDFQGGFFMTGSPDGSPASFFRLKPDGTIDQQFSSLPELLSWIACLVPERSGSLWLGGVPKTPNGPSIFHILANGQVDPLFTETNSFTRAGGAFINSIIPEENGDLVVAGVFTEFDGLPVHGLVRLKGPKPLQLTLSNPSERILQMRVPTLPGRTFVIEQSNDLRTWSPLSTNEAPAFEWQFPLPASGPSQFLRVFHKPN